MVFNNRRLQVLTIFQEFPNITSNKMIYNWFVGNEIEKVPLFILLQNNNISHTKTDKSKNSGRVGSRIMRSVMKAIQKNAIE